MFRIQLVSVTCLSLGPRPEEKQPPRLFKGCVKTGASEPRWVGARPATPSPSWARFPKRRNGQEGRKGERKEGTREAPRTPALPRWAPARWAHTKPWFVKSESRASGRWRALLCSLLSCFAPGTSEGGNWGREEAGGTQSSFNVRWAAGKLHRSMLRDQDAPRSMPRPLHCDRYKESLR